MSGAGENWRQKKNGGGGEKKKKGFHSEVRLFNI